MEDEAANQENGCMQVTKPHQPG